MDQASWDDMRVLLAVAREGTVRGAAEILGTSHSTVMRRIAALEDDFEVRLFERTREGYALTAAGQNAFVSAGVLEDQMVELQRKLQGAETSLRGTVRITLAHVFLPFLLRELEPLAKAHPEIRLEFVTAVDFVSLAHRDADIAVRVAQEPGAELVGRMVGYGSVGIYASQRYLKSAGKRPWQNYDWIGWDQRASGPLGPWIDEHISEERVRYRLSGPANIDEAISADLGVSILPTVHGRYRKDWKLIEAVEDLQAPVWVLSHEDLRTNARVRLVRDYVAERLKRPGVLR